MASKSNKWIWVITIVVVIVIVVVAWFMRPGTQPAPPPEPEVTTSAVPAPPQPPIQHPMVAAPASTSAPALPALGESDASVVQALARMAGGKGLGDLLINQHIIERIVATVDALPRHKIGNNVVPLHPPKGSFAVAQVNGQPVLAEADFARYAPYMAWLRNTDTETAVNWYARMYPLFQQAYRELGYPDGYFNDRLVQVLKHLLAAPEPAQPVALVKTDKGYAFADADLEALSTGQKLMIRVGPDNEKLIKQKLREVLAAITSGKGPDDAANP